MSLKLTVHELEIWDKYAAAALAAVANLDGGHDRAVRVAADLADKLFEERNARKKSLGES
ncbi:hypothetical protein IFR08_10715 [Pseudomonas fluorescens]|jgi:hypothetical protein|uniref:hypothetical protein n=1 Tax=Pseudomonas TaxID=286 RepID=UPI00177F451C|nr:hypothetical protein [Pseudomonas fluorescens]MBD8099802.1 hypothetical protein [Pseudomonas fluorescens]MBD8774239.1 hypothetical protein [Pseudomonas fluorescens]MBD8781301.1 hypothetical protein [Pseudomonas fluorescens]MBD8796606.1 hypothetical protein [Pseudomonas fluorescens]